MTAPLILTTTVAVTALAPVPELGFVLQLAGLGAAIGAAVALRAKHRAPTVDTWQITTVWATLGLAAGMLSALISLVV